MRHGRLIGRMALGALLPAVLLPAVLLPAVLLLSALPAAAQEGQNINVRALVLSETRIAPAATQLFQVTLANTNKQAMPVGLKAELRDTHDRRVGSPLTRQVTLPARDEERFLFKFRAPEAEGDFVVRFEVLTADFKGPVIPGGPVFLSPFAVGTGRAAPRPATMQQARLTAPNFLPPSGLKFEKPDLLWERLIVSPKSLLLGETLHIKADLRNVGGDLVRNTQVRVVYANTRTPNRLEPISETTVQVLAPGEKLEMEFETVLPDSALLGEYVVTLTADATDTVDELDETNNTVVTDPIRLTRIKLVFPDGGYAFEEQGLFLFRWDSLRFDEFKVQVSTDADFSDPSNTFDLPQGEKWTKDKEIVPLEGELPAMAQGLLEKTKAARLFWRVEGRESKSGRTGLSETLPFTIKPSPKPKETQAPGAAPSAMPPATMPPASAPPREPAAQPPSAPASQG